MQIVWQQCLYKLLGWCSEKSYYFHKLKILHQHQKLIYVQRRIVQNIMLLLFQIRNQIYMN